MSEFTENGCEVYIVKQQNYYKYVAQIFFSIFFVKSLYFEINAKLVEMSLVKIISNDKYLDI